MKNTTRQILGLALVVFSTLVFPSCKKLLELQPPFDVPLEEAFRNPNDVENAINGMYQGLQQGQAAGGGFRIASDVFTDQFEMFPTSFNQGNLGSYFNAYIRQNFQAGDGIWRAAYLTINRANNVLEVVENDSKYLDDVSEPFYQNNRGRYLGEAYFVRAYMHFELLRLFSHQYGVNQNAEHSGVILKTKPSNDKSPQKRATTEEVYNLVLSDLDKAISSLPEQADPVIHSDRYGGIRGGRAVKDAALAMKARVLFQKGTPEADEQCLEVINQVLGTAAGNPQKYDPRTDKIISSSENLFTLFGFEAANETIFQTNNTFNRSTNEVNATSAGLVNAYTLIGEENDLGIKPQYIISRRAFEAAIRPFSITNDGRQAFINRKASFFLNKYQNAARGSSAPIFNVILLRSSEFLLTRAEIFASKGQRSEAISDMWVVFNRANPGADETAFRNNLSAMDDITFRNRISAERTFELVGEGDYFHYFKRRASRYGLADAKFLANSNYRLFREMPWNSNNSIFQIPDAEITANPLVVRNP